MKIANLLSVFTLFALIFVLSSCDQDGKKENVNINGNLEHSETYLAALNNYKNNSTASTAQALIREIKRSLSESNDEGENLEYLKQGLEIAENNKLGSTAIGFLMPLVKDYPTVDSEKNFAKLTSALLDVGNSVPGNILAKSYLEKYANGEFKDVISQKQTTKIDNLEEYVTKMAEDIFVNPDKFGINKSSAQKYVDACEAYALGYPNAQLAPEYLYKAAEMARTLKTFPKALNIYDWIQDKYPNYSKTPTVLFLKGFMLENELKDKEAAKGVYNDFLQKFPDDKLADDIQFLLDNIDKSDEEIMKMIEEVKLSK